MAIFSEKVISAKFIDPPNNMLIEVLYREGDIVTPYVLEVDFTQQDFNDLLSEISLDEIQETTRKELNAQAKFFYDIIEKEVDQRLKVESEKFNNKPNDLSGKEIFNYILKKDNDKEFLFDFKIGILEDPDILKSNNKNLKLSIRKSKSVLELIKLYGEAKGIS